MVYNQGLAASIREVGSELKIKTGNFEEIEYFDRVKKFLNNKHVYAEFLKCLNLFSQEIISRHDLVTLMQGFLGGAPELFEWFKKFIGYKEPPPGKQSLLFPFSLPCAPFFSQDEGYSFFPLIDLDFS